VLVIAHRGASAELPENTLPALDRAIELGADAIEIDVRADRARHLVLTHDPVVRGGSYATLEEALDVCRGRIPLMVELKTPRRYRRYDVVARTVRLLGSDDALVCFQRAALQEARQLRRGLKTVQHVGLGVSIRGARDAWAAGFANGRVTARGIAAARALGLETLVYTVNEPARMLELAELGAGGIFTDRPDLALPLFRGAARRP
jgi:glycerophosphoryl diester phosphodiesterase